jgi:UDP-N-acetylmuramate--alanine ligase
MTRWNRRFDFAAPVPAAAELRRAHFIAIGGAGMSAVARLMLARGMAVSGSDQNDSPVLEVLRAAGASVTVGHSAATVTALPDGAVVVVSSAIRDDNPELAAARERGQQVLHRAQGLATLLPGNRVAAVAGANGKTTTSAMLAAALRTAGLDPSFAIGAPPVGHDVGAGLGGGDVFVVEADESDSSFLVYHPDVAVVTNLMPDHLDFYGTFERVTRAYDEFVATIAPGGLLVTCADDEGARGLAERARADGVRVVTYGVASDADVRLTGLGGAGFDWGATVLEDGQPPRRLGLRLPGAHNVLDAAGAYTAATTGLGADPDLVLQGLAAFPGTSRRFEPRGEAAGVRVVDDYAHNPGKVAAAVRTGRGLTGPGRLVVVFQPHLYSRTRDFAAELAAALSPADVVVVLDVYRAREDPVPGVTGALVADRVTGAEVHYLPDRAEVAAAVHGLVRPGDLVLTVGAGDVTAVGPQLLRLLSADGVLADPAAPPAAPEGPAPSAGSSSCA